jgi:hypothetical protein
MEKGEIREVILEAMASGLKAQLGAVQRLRGEKPEEPAPQKRMSQVDMVHDVLVRAGTPLHINDILERVRMLHGQELDRESIVSALTKKVKREDRFVRTAPNTFGLIEEGR